MRIGFMMGKKVSRLHKRVLHGHTITALWTGMRVYLLKDGEMILQECFSARSKRVVTFVIPAALWGKKELFTFFTNKQDCIKEITGPTTTFLSSPPRPQILAQQGDLITPSNPRRNEVRNVFVSKRVLVNYKN